MKSKTDQLDFDFSRPIDFQRNISSEIIDDCVSELFKENKNSLFKKHLKILILELYYCWIESDKQFLTVSMSKRGYNSKSRYNPNNISSYLIKVINLLVKNKLINFHAGFYDTRTKKSRLTRIKSSKILINQFEKIKLLSTQGVNHRKKEYLLIYNKGKLYEYKDSYDTQEIRVVLENYNKIISKTLFDIPSFEGKILVRGDNKKITISPFSSIFYKKEVEKLDEGLIGGCWWNMIDLHLFLNIKNKLTINNKKTSYLDLTNYFANYLSLVSNSNISSNGRIKVIGKAGLYENETIGSRGLFFEDTGIKGISVKLYGKGGESATKLHNSDVTNSYSSASNYEWGNSGIELRDSTIEGDTHVFVKGTAHCR